MSNTAAGLRTSDALQKGGKFYVGPTSSITRDGHEEIDPALFHHPTAEQISRSSNTAAGLRTSDALHYGDLLVGPTSSVPSNGHEHDAPLPSENGISKGSPPNSHTNNGWGRLSTSAAFDNGAKLHIGSPYSPTGSGGGSTPQRTLLSPRGNTQVATAHHARSRTTEKSPGPPTKAPPPRPRFHHGAAQDAHDCDGMIYRPSQTSPRSKEGEGRESPRGVQVRSSPKPSAQRKTSPGVRQRTDRPVSRTRRRCTEEGYSEVEMCGIGLHMEQSGMLWIVGGVLKGGPAEKTSIRVVIIDDNL